MNELILSSSPHIRTKASTSSIMWTVFLCLVPAGVWGVINFGIGSLFVILVSIFASVLTEFVITRLQKKSTLQDGSAFLTGLLIAYNMPASIPLFIPVAASVFAIAVVKHTFGGLGRNWMNPALAGRVFALFSWTKDMTTWPPSLLARAGSGLDAVTGATPLELGFTKYFASGGSYLDLFLGLRSGCIGEVSILLLLAGAFILFIKKIITWEIPFSYIVSFSILVLLFGGPAAGNSDVLFHLLTGGIILGAFYMATDMVTSPLSGVGMIVFGAGCGFLTFLIRFFGGFPEGVSLAIILMNMFVPFINQFTKPKKYGMVKEFKKGLK